MIVSSAPLRVSLNSADHLSFSTKFGGAALNLCIDKRVYVIIRRRNHMEEFKYRISYSTTELCNSLDEIKHPLVREAIRMCQVNIPLEIIYSADLPARVGLGTSSAMANALIRGLLAYKNGAMSNELLAEWSYNLERNIIREAGGYQDNFATAFGGINYLTGSPGSVRREAISLSPEMTESFVNHMILIYTGNLAQSSVILEEQLEKLRRGKTLDETLQIKKLVEEMYATMIQPDFKPMDLSHAIREGWELKKRLSSNMTSPAVDEIVGKVLDVAPKAGLRLVGGGGGRGFILVLCEPDYIPEIITRVTPYKTLRFNVDWEGTKIHR
jgi:D-glycero-alpha-D-manno-heptose-7-phosphate kinase